MDHSALGKDPNAGRFILFYDEGRTSERRMTSEEMEGDLRSDSEFILDDLEQMFISNYFAIPKELRNQRTVFASLMSSGLLYPIAILFPLSKP